MVREKAGYDERYHQGRHRTRDDGDSGGDEHSYQPLRMADGGGHSGRGGAGHCYPAAQLLKRDPREMGLLPDGETQLEPGSPLPSEAGLTFRQAVRTRQLWLLCGFYAAFLFAAQSVMLHVVPYAVDLGISETVAASLIAVVGGSSIAGRLVMGFSSDKIGRKRGILISFVIMVLVLSYLLTARQLWMLYLFAAVYGFNHGGFMPRSRL